MLGVFLDIFKAFDKFLHRGLPFRLKQNGTSAASLKVTNDFLSSCKQRVDLNGQHSTWSDTLADFPKGTIYT